MQSDSFVIEFQNKVLNIKSDNFLQNLISCGVQGMFEYEENGVVKKIYIEQDEEYNSFIAYSNSETIKFKVLSKREERLATLRKSSQTSHSRGVLITAQMPGLVKDIFVNVGATIKKGDALFILEAMKMENEIKSPINSIVKRILATAGNPIEKGGLILELEPIL